MPARPIGRHFGWLDLLPLVALSLPAFALFRRSLEVGPSCATLAGAMDARLVNYILEWGYLHLQGLAGPGRSLWSPPFFFPVPDVLAYSENMIAGYPTYFPLRWMGLSPPAALLGFHLVQRTLTPLAAYLCLRWMRIGRWASFVGAALFGWSWVRFIHYGHIQFSAGYTIPLFFTSLYAFGWRRRPWAAAVAAWTFLFTWYFSLYTAVFLLVATAALALVALVLPGGWGWITRTLRWHLAYARRHRGTALSVLLVCAVAMLLLLPSTTVYLRVYQGFGPVSESELRLYWGSPWSWLRPPSLHPILGSLTKFFPAPTGGGVEKMSFIGWLALAGLGMPLGGLLLRGRGIYRLWRRPVVAASVAGIGLILVFSSYGGAWPELPYWFLRDHFPGLGGLRAPGRISFEVSWLAVVCLTSLVDRLQTRPSSATLLAWGLGAVLLVEGVAPLPEVVDRCAVERTWVRTAEHLCPQIPRDQVGTLMFLPMDIHSLHSIQQNGLAMTLSLSCDLNVVNGYSGRRPQLIAPLFGAAPAELPCDAVRTLVDEAHRASGKGVLIHLDRGRPQGPAQYSAAKVRDCLSPCLRLAVTWYRPRPGRPADLFVTDPAARCSPASSTADAEPAPGSALHSRVNAGGELSDRLLQRQLR